MRAALVACGLGLFAAVTAPVNSPDEERAVSAAMSNAVAFTCKLDGGCVPPVAPDRLAVSPR